MTLVFFEKKKRKRRRDKQSMAATENAEGLHTLLEAERFFNEIFNDYASSSEEERGGEGDFSSGDEANEENENAEEGSIRIQVRVNDGMQAHRISCSSPLFYIAGQVFSQSDG